MKTKIYNYIAAILALGLFSLTACENEEPTGLTEEPGTAKIIFINAAPNGATQASRARREIAIYPYYNQITFNNFPIKFPWSNGYKHFAPGTLSMRLDTARSIGNDPPGPQATVAQLEVPLQADTYYSLYAIGTAQNVETVLLTDNLSLPTPGKAKVRMMNYSPDAGPMDLVLVSGGTLTAPVTIASNLSYKGLKDFFEIDPGTYTVEMRVAGTTTRIGGQRTNVIIDPNSCYSFWAAGFRTMPSPGNTFAGYALDLRYHANRWSNPLVK